MKVIWLHRAEIALFQTEEYIQNEFGTKASVRFMKEVEEVAYLLERMPELGHYEPLLSNYVQGYRSIVINKLTKLIYYIKGNDLLIATLWDTRREPKSLANNIK